MNSSHLIVFILLIGIVLLIILVKYLFKKINKIYSFVEVKRLKNKGNRISVNLVNCSIYNNIIPKTKKNIYNEISDLLYNPQNQESIKSFDLRLFYTGFYENNSVQFYSDIITVEIDSLADLLQQKKETIIYIDKENNCNYYFDIEFINGN